MIFFFFGTVDIQTPLIDGLLCRGSYLFVGSPKVGKSFMMAQLAYHISTGLPLWEYKVRKATTLYFALEDDYARLQKRLFQMFGADYSYVSDYDIVARLKALADSYKVTMLIVHHTRKQKVEDIFDTISGTNRLMGTGRDQQDMKIHLVRDTGRLVWDFEKNGK